MITNKKDNKSDIELGNIQKDEDIDLAEEIHEDSSSLQTNDSNSCAICLDTFQINEMIAWSGNEKCNHVFHQKCIVDWFSLSFKKRRNTNAPSISFPCPCCRCEYVTLSSNTCEDQKHHDSNVQIDGATSMKRDDNETIARNSNNTQKYFEFCVSHGLVPSSQLKRFNKGVDGSSINAK